MRGFVQVGKLKVCIELFGQIRLSEWPSGLAGSAGKRCP
jgi:hypothetical protein